MGVTDRGLAPVRDFAGLGRRSFQKTSVYRICARRDGADNLPVARVARQECSLRLSLKVRDLEI